MHNREFSKKTTEFSQNNETSPTDASTEAKYPSEVSIDSSADVSTESPVSPTDVSSICMASPSVVSSTLSSHDNDIDTTDSPNSPDSLSDVPLDLTNSPAKSTDEPVNDNKTYIIKSAPDPVYRGTISVLSNILADYSGRSPSINFVEIKDEAVLEPSYPGKGKD